MQFKKSMDALLLDLRTKQKINKNQKEVIKMVRNAKEPILINPTVLVKGSIEHYYHFIHDLLFPLCLVLSRVSPKSTFLMQDFGPLTQRLQEILGPRLQITGDTSSAQEIELLGMDALALDKLHFQYSGFRKYIFRKLNINQRVTPNKIILIERIKPHSYYMTRAKAKNGGSLRREVTNQHELAEFIARHTAAPFEFQNVILDNMSLEEQVKLFHSSAIVIAQHGAALANIVWMQKNTTVIEFGHHDLAHFRKLCSASKVQHYVYRNFTTRKIHIELDDFLEWLLDQPTLTRAFQYAGKIASQ